MWNSCSGDLQFSSFSFFFSSSSSSFFFFFEVLGVSVCVHFSLGVCLVSGDSFSLSFFSGILM